ncbi:uncharacterized protein EHS24_001945 [Apiotrichum porosum]|uniref:Uncharacterized protein n=1 Tax=Apiotrichum porosum TaxID=105984 RepID=A0A427XJT8_9TREE|nr:uncharacterized protein EHS24_001945 [Apiotrichum porosum]RSH79017.1 hypothetical protein EHS24_001945 [Apiotrichum porosum]
MYWRKSADRPGEFMCKECEQSMTRGGRRTTSIAGRCSACDKRSDDMVYGFDLGVECYAHAACNECKTTSTCQWHMCDEVTDTYIRKRNRKVGYVCADLGGVKGPARWVDAIDPDGIPIKLCGTCWAKRVLRTKLYADIAAAERAIASGTLLPTTSNNPTCILGCRCDKSTPSVWQPADARKNSLKHKFKPGEAYYLCNAHQLKLEKLGAASGHKCAKCKGTRTVRWHKEATGKPGKEVSNRLSNITDTTLSTFATPAITTSSSSRLSGEVDGATMDVGPAREGSMTRMQRLGLYEVRREAW